MRNLLVAASAIALMTGAAHATENKSLEEAADATGDAIERSVEATGEALGDAGDAIAETARDWTNGLREIDMAGAKYTLPQDNSFSARDVVGTPIYGQDGKVVARVDDIWISGDGKVEAFLVDHGGFLGIGEDEVAMKSGTVTFAHDGAGNVFGSAGLSEEQLEKIADTRYDAKAEYRADPASYEGLTVEDDLIGHAVVNNDGETLASVRDVLLTSDGDISHLVLAQGGVLGFGGELVAVNYGGLNYEQGDADGALVIDTSAKELKAMPEFRYHMRGEASAQ